MKRLAEAKSRLAGQLIARERRRLALQFLHRVLTVASEAQEDGIARAWVISADRGVLDLAASYGLTPLDEQLNHEEAASGGANVLQAGEPAHGSVSAAGFETGSRRWFPGEAAQEERANATSTADASTNWVDGSSSRECQLQKPPAIDRAQLQKAYGAEAGAGSLSANSQQLRRLDEEQVSASGDQTPGDKDLALNAALEQATSHAAANGASAVLILPADLPFLSLDDVKALWQASQQLYSPWAMVIAPDDREQGTNALLVRPPGVLSYQFGPGSFRRHCQQAQDLGMAWHIHRSARLGLDVDVPADLQRYLDATAGTADMEPSRVFPDALALLADDRVFDFLQQPGLLMRLGTVGRDGYPQVTPVWYLFEDGRFFITTASDRVKARNMLDNARIGCAIDSDRKPYRGLSVWGQAHLYAEGEAARRLTRRIAARYVPSDRLDAMVASLMQAPRVVFAIEPVRVALMGSWAES